RRHTRSKRDWSSDVCSSDLEDGAADWPDRLRPALGLVGFARQLRDVMLRAAERGYGPEDIEALGRAEDRPDWVAVGRFAARYEQIGRASWRGRGVRAAGRRC